MHTLTRFHCAKPHSISEGPVRAEVDRSPVTDAPGIPFIVAARTYLNDDTSTQVEGVKVEVSLAPANATSLANCSAEQRAAVAAQRCTVVSGAPPVPAGAGASTACTLTLPCEADLMIRACAFAFTNGTAIKGGLGGKPPCSQSPIGRNASTWAKSPWSFQPQLQLLKDRVNYTLGSNATISFSTPPYAGTMSGFLIWGDKDTQMSRSIPKIPAGPNRVEIGPLGDECRGGCKVALVLSAGRRGSDAAKALVPKVKKSKLFDPLGPHTMSDSVDLTILGDNRLSVDVRVEGDAGLRTRQGNVSVAAPLGGATVTVKVTDADGGAPAAGAQVGGWGVGGAQ